MAQLVDTHAHLTDPRLDVREIIASMDADGLDRIITVGYNMETSAGGLAIAKTDPRVFCCLGFHPSNAHEVKDGDYDKLLAFSKDEKVVAIGEIGLDYHYDDTDKPVQRAALLRQLDLVKAADLPAVFHLRDAEGDMNALIAENRGKLPRGGVMHCFSGSLETARFYADLGFYISFSGSVTFKNAKKFSEIVRGLPLDRILIETDCPYLAPEPFRGRLNYPKYVRYQAERIAEILGKTFEEVAALTAKNAYGCFEKLK